MGVPLHKPVPVFFLKLDKVKICVNRLEMVQIIFMKIHKKLDELVSCEKIREHRGGVYIRKILGSDGSFLLLYSQICFSLFRFDFICQNIEERCFSCSVPA